MFPHTFPCTVTEVHCCDNGGVTLFSAGTVCNDSLRSSVIFPHKLLDEKSAFLFWWTIIFQLLVLKELLRHHGNVHCETGEIHDIWFAVWLSYTAVIFNPEHICAHTQNSNKVARWLRDSLGDRLTVVGGEGQIHRASLLTKQTSCSRHGFSAIDKPVPCQGCDYFSMCRGSAPQQHLWIQIAWSKTLENSCQLSAISPTNRGLRSFWSLADAFVSAIAASWESK